MYKKMGKNRHCCLFGCFDFATKERECHDCRVSSPICGEYK